MPTFAALKTRVENYLLDLPSETQALVGEWINKALREGEERHNFRHMEAEAAFTTVTGQRSLGTKPSDWKEARTAPWLLFNDGESREIAWAASASDMVRTYAVGDAEDEGRPEFVLETAAGFEVYPFPDGQADYPDDEYRVNIPYWARTADLAADADTNWWTDEASWYLTYAAVAEGMIFNREEERAQTYILKAENELQREIRLDKRSRLPRRLTLTPRADVYAPGKRPVR